MPRLGNTLDFSSLQRSSQSDPNRKALQYAIDDSHSPRKTWATVLLDSALKSAQPLSKDCGSSPSLIPILHGLVRSFAQFRTLTMKLYRVQRSNLPRHLNLTAILFLPSIISLATALPSNVASPHVLTLTLPTNLTYLNLTHVHSSVIPTLIFPQSPCH